MIFFLGEKWKSEKICISDFLWELNIYRVIKQIHHVIFLDQKASPTRFDDRVNDNNISL